MASLIEHDDRNCMLRCTQCKGCVSLPWKVYSHPDRKLAAVESFTRLHADCKLLLARKQEQELAAMRIRFFARPGRNARTPAVH